MEEWFRILKELTSPRITPRLEYRIHQEILTKAEHYTRETAQQEHEEGIELLGKLVIAHSDYTENHGVFGDMFGQYFTEMQSLNRRCGQILTPIHVAEAIVKMTIPDIPEKPQAIMDPAAGTGRFMLMTAKHYATATGKLNFIFFNIDIEFSVYVYCSMNAILNGVPAITVWGDSLKMDYREAVATIPIGKVAIWKMLDKDAVNRIMPQPKREKNLLDFAKR